MRAECDSETHVPTTYDQSVTFEQSVTFDQTGLDQPRFEPSPLDASTCSWTLSCAKAWRMDDETLRDIFTRIVGRMVLDHGDTVMRAVMPFLAERRDCRSMTRAEMLAVVKQHEERFNPPDLPASGARAGFAPSGLARHG